VERYMAKPEEFPEELQTGRIWGIWNENLLPVHWKKVEVSLRDAFRIRRIYIGSWQGGRVAATCAVLRCS
jgi:hypothetical protein